MILALRFLFLLVLLSMLWVTTWASLDCALWRIPAEVFGHRWFIATLFDAYWGFITFWLWLAWRERSWLRSGLWLVAVLLLGNIAMSAYMLLRLFSVPATASFDRVLLPDEPCKA